MSENTQDIQAKPKFKIGSLSGWLYGLFMAELTLSYGYRLLMFLVGAAIVQDSPGALDILALLLVVAAFIGMFYFACKKSAVLVILYVHLAFSITFITAEPGLLRIPTFALTETIVWFATVLLTRRFASEERRRKSGDEPKPISVADRFAAGPSARRIAACGYIVAILFVLGMLLFPRYADDFYFGAPSGFFTIQMPFILISLAMLFAKEEYLRRKLQGLLAVLFLFIIIYGLGEAVYLMSRGNLPFIFYSARGYVVLFALLLGAVGAASGKHHPLWNWIDRFGRAMKFR